MVPRPLQEAFANSVSFQANNLRTMLLVNILHRSVVTYTCSQMSVEYSVQVMYAHKVARALRK